MVDLHSAGHRRGVVCAPHYGAVGAGRSILAEGGNALEAMVAMAASIAAVYPHMNHIGGDGFWLIREPNGRVRAIMAPGPAGSQAQPEFYAEYEAIPPRGPLAALVLLGHRLLGPRVHRLVPAAFQVGELARGGVRIRVSKSGVRHGINLTGPSHERITLAP